MTWKLESGTVLNASGFTEGTEYGRGIKRERGGPMFSVSVDKVGGGTRGKAYDGDWTVTLLRNGRVIFDAERLTTGTPKMHHEVAEMAVDFAIERDEN